MNQLLIFGDSITWGAYDEQGGWAERIKNDCDKIIIKTQKSSTSVFVLGIPGDNIKKLLQRMEKEAHMRIDSDYDTITLIAIGINDSQVNIQTKHAFTSIEIFRRDIKLIIEKAKEFSEEIIFVGPTPVDETRVYPIPWKKNYGYKNEQIVFYNNSIKELAFSHSCGFIDIYSKLIVLEYKSLLLDGLHPNTKGHELLYKIIKKYLDNLYLLS